MMTNIYQSSTPWHNCDSIHHFSLECYSRRKLEGRNSSAVHEKLVKVRSVKEIVSPAFFWPRPWSRPREQARHNGVKNFIKKPNFFIQIAFWHKVLSKHFSITAFENTDSQWKWKCDFINNVNTWSRSTPRPSVSWFDPKSPGVSLLWLRVLMKGRDDQLMASSAKSWGKHWSWELEQAELARKTRY